MSYPETENTYNTLIESKIYRTSVSFVILFAYIAISNCALDTIFFEQSFCDIFAKSYQRVTIIIFYFLKNKGIICSVIM